MHTDGLSCVCPCLLTGGLAAAADPLAGGPGASTLGSKSVCVLLTRRPTGSLHTCPAPACVFIS